ncbi:hypothetical protein GLAREA_02768 [Glarea lozoyensis ATCC 20868]|uniref:Uncharacterized protein n=1 Tax=Glarea lozoyensis (strain ATCC 20868 / MF5171) TaxID=1116229 RepID=S3CNW3_GLAL2|nr:uncharacterized protein GLAREA_02768 [Glarea lozoyensis ATCC 20868]EPE26854.1 hypothetical protein GLAREA_02768 [Glarea lozoyensis ATCC 20868]
MEDAMEVACGSPSRQLTIRTTSMHKNTHQETCDWSSEDGDNQNIYTPTSSTDSANEMIATPTSSTASQTVTESPSPAPGQENSESQPLNSSTTPNLPLDDRAEASCEAPADDEEVSDISMWPTATRTDDNAEEFDPVEVQNAVAASASFTEMALAQDIEKALKESLELLDLERLEYEPATREQHRIQSAYVEDLTAEPGYHSKEDDKFFFEEVLDDTPEPEEDENEDEDTDQPMCEDYESLI